MRESPSRRDDFEQRLLNELKSIVAQRGAEQAALTEIAAGSRGRPRALRLALGATAVLAIAVALVLNSGSNSTPKAFAVERHGGGGVTIEVYSPEEAEGLEAALAETGIRSQVTWLPAGRTCREPHFTPSSTKTALGGKIGGITLGGPSPAMTIGVMSSERYRERWREYRRGQISEDEFLASTGNITLDPAELRADQTVVIFGSPGPYDGDPEGGYEAHFAIAEGPVEPCDPVRADRGLLGAMNRVLDR